MTIRFRPPPLARFYADAESDAAAALVAAQERGFAEGRAAGLSEGHAAAFAEGEAQARATLRPEIKSLLDVLAKREKHDAVADLLERVLAAREADLMALEATVRDLAVTALRALFPVLLSGAAGGEIAALLADALAERAPGSLSLRAHPDTLAAVAAETTAAVAAGRLTLVADPRLEFAAVEFAWTGGGMTFDPDSLLARVTSLLTPAPIPRRTGEALDAAAGPLDRPPFAAAAPSREALEEPDPDSAHPDAPASLSEPNANPLITETSP